MRLHDGVHGGTAAENYERHVVPAIGAPLGTDLVEIAELRPGERVLDAACGTGVVARLAAPRREFANDGSMILQLRIVVAAARKQ